MASATLRGITMPSTIGKVVLLELLTDFWHTGLASSGAQDFAGKADEVVAGCGSLLTIAGARPKSKYASSTRAGAGRRRTGESRDVDDCWLEILLGWTKWPDIVHSSQNEEAAVGVSISSGLGIEEATATTGNQNIMTRRLLLVIRLRVESWVRFVVSE